VRQLFHLENSEGVIPFFGRLRPAFGLHASIPVSLLGKKGVCKPFLSQINGSNPKSTVDLEQAAVDLRLGLAGLVVMGMREAGRVINKQSFFSWKTAQIGVIR
jgi:hypothetical protein